MSCKWKMAPIAFANGPTNSNQIFLLQSSKIMKSLSHKNRWSSRSPRYYDMFKSIPIQDIWSPESSIGKSLILRIISGTGPKPQSCNLPAIWTGNASWNLRKVNRKWRRLRRFLIWKCLKNIWGVEFTFLLTSALYELQVHTGCPNKFGIG